jgi:anti-sigma factor RsiW
MSTADDFPCRDLVEALTDYLEDAMDPGDRTRLEAHLAICEGCTTVLEQFRDTIRVTGYLTEEEVSRPDRESVRAVFRAWRAEAGI